MALSITLQEQSGRYHVEDGFGGIERQGRFSRAEDRPEVAYDRSALGLAKLQERAQCAETATRVNCGLATAA